MDTQSAYLELRDAILSARIGAGERLVTQQLADQMGASRTPVREALARLEGEGLVERAGNWGYSVKVVSLPEAEHLFEARIVIEVANARFAAQRGDDDGIDAMETWQRKARRHLARGQLVEFQRASRGIHEAIAVAADNSQMLRMFRQISDFVVLFGVTLLKASPARAAEIVNENDAIIAAIRGHDADAAAAATAAHIQRGHQHFRDALARHQRPLRIVPG